MLIINPEQAEQGKKGDGWIGPAPWVETELPGPKSKAVLERDQAVSSPSYTRDYPLVVNRSSGSVVEDLDGNRFLDLAAGIAVCATGHCHPKVVAAIEAQARKLIHICGSDFYYPVMVEVMEKLAAIAPGPGGKRVFLTNSGAEAIEGAIKLARYATGRKWILAFFGGFHGRTLGALSLTCSKAVQQGRFGPMLPMVAHAPYGDLEFIEQLFKYKVPADEVAAIFVEAVQGEGGYRIAPPEFLPQLRHLCDKHGILLVADEVQTGIGRTGKWFAIEHFDTVPDIVCVAKGVASGMPLGAFIAREELMTWPPGAHGSTFGGNPVCCAAASATLELVESAYMANAAKLNPLVMRSLREMSEKHKCIAHPRGLGLMCAADVVGKRTGKADAGLRGRILQEAFRRGVILLPCGESGIRIAPPLCINETQLEVGLRVLDEAVATVE